MCNGSVVFSTTMTPGPFTAILTNSASCPNSTVQSSTGNAVTISSLCTCSGNYTVSIFNSSNILVGFELLQVPITATSALTLMTPTINPALCPTCCNGSVYIGWSGGYAPTVTDATLTIDGSNIGSSYFPNPTVCVGQHTLCVTDLDNCEVCTTFSMGFAGVSGLKENYAFSQISISPNPSFDQIQINTSSSEPIGSIQCFDLDGKLVLQSYEGQGLSNKISLDVFGLKPGIYLIEVLNKNNATIGRQKLVKILQ